MSLPDDSSSAGELLKLRRAKVDQWRSRGNDPFGTAFPDSKLALSVINSYEEDKPVKVAGRLVSIRDMGKSVFAHILDQSGRIQLYAQKNVLGEEVFGQWKLLDLGDWVGAEGTLFTTKSGEKSIRVSSLMLLSKTLRPIPSEWYGLADPEARYRQRYLDLISNPGVRDILTKRSQIVREVRRFMEEHGFLEVETPMMQSIAGGAAARPFQTHHNALGLDLYLRIAPELYLKRLLVGGFEKVFEVNRNFRNEGISRKHNPEFTMMEAYWAYADFDKMASLVESLITTVAERVFDTLAVGARDSDPANNLPGREAIDLTPPWPRVRYRDVVREAAGADWFELTPEDRRARCAELGVEISPAMQDFEVTNQVFEKLVEARTLKPVFITHLPKELVPLAKQNAEDPSVVDVFELIINGQEISPGYTELNDPIIQRERLLEQAGEETQLIDEDFLTALEYGMPPAGGIGIGIDRLVMLLTGAESIRDVILFPLMRPVSKDK
ncbi:MAG: lysine--tRNA ligase [Candidatus Methylacidiphilales bacterium]|nr:lysine--tRNA ligase [Candidatus Methylacidiphilales bacterium]